MSWNLRTVLPAYQTSQFCEICSSIDDISRVIFKQAYDIEIVEKKYHSII